MDGQASPTHFVHKCKSCLSVVTNTKPAVANRDLTYLGQRNTCPKAAHERDSGRLRSHGCGGPWAAWPVGLWELSLGGLGCARDGNFQNCRQALSPVPSNAL